MLVCGGPCSGKSALASALAARLNLGAPVHVDALSEALRGEERRGGAGSGAGKGRGGGGGETPPSSAAARGGCDAVGAGDGGCSFVGGGPLPSRPPWTTPKPKPRGGGGGGGGGEPPSDAGGDDGGFDAEQWDREARALRAALSRDVLKAARDGRSAVLEGGGLDPGLFTGALAAPLARAWEEEIEEEDEEEEEEEEEEEGGGSEGEEEGEEEGGEEARPRRRRRHQHQHRHRQQQRQLFRRPPAAGGPPAIVPILVTMEPKHQALLVREACERDPGLAGAAGGADPEGAAVDRAVARAAAAARHVASRAAAAAPPPPPLVCIAADSSEEGGAGSTAVLRIATSLRAGDAERAVERLHAALLSVMEAMEASSAAAAEAEVGGEEDGGRR